MLKETFFLCGYVKSNLCSVILKRLEKLPDLSNFLTWILIH